jgi:hypothetical protein
MLQSERVRAVISAGLPKFDKKTTYGVLITNEGDVVPLQSGDADPRYSNYPPRLMWRERPRYGYVIMDQLGSSLS